MSSTRKIVSIVLFPLTIWYAVGVFVRNFLFNAGILKQSSPHVTTIGVGNLSCGGTGKTPHAEYLLRMFADKYRTAYLSRGYRRHSRGFVLADSTTPWEQIGDEAAMIAHKFPQVMVAVCERRSEGIAKLMARETPPELIILDDAYQHRYIKPTLNILLTEYSRPFSEDNILPYGNLREFKSGRGRANIIVITKTPTNANPIAQHNIKHALRAQPYQKIFFSTTVYGSKLVHAVNGSTREWSEVDHAVIFAGIAHPNDLNSAVKEHCSTTLIPFEDHHSYTLSDIQTVVERYNQAPGEKKIILTTEKDAVKLQAATIKELLSELPIYYLQLDLTFSQVQNHDFDSAVSSIVRENISFLQRLSSSPLTNRVSSRK